MSTVKSLLKDYIVDLKHVGHIVPDLNQAVAEFKRIYGVTDNDIHIEPPEGVETPTRFAFIDVAGTEFELIEPIAEPFLHLKDMPCGLGGINHVAWLVRDIDDAVALLAEKGIKPGHVTPDGVLNLGMKKMVYLDPTTTGGCLIELIEILS